MFRLIRFIFFMGLIYFAFTSLNLNAAPKFVTDNLITCPSGFLSDSVCFEYPDEPDLTHSVCPSGSALGFGSSEEDFNSRVESQRNFFNSFPDTFTGKCSNLIRKGDRIVITCDAVRVANCDFTQNCFAFNRVSYSINSTCQTDPFVPEEEEELDYDCENPYPVKSFYESSYTQGLSKIIDDSHEQFKDQPVMDILNLQWPSSGSNPSFSIDMNYSFAKMGSFNFQIPIVIYGFIRLILLVTAGFTCRFIIFGA